MATPADHAHRPAERFVSSKLRATLLGAAPVWFLLFARARPLDGSIAWFMLLGAGLLLLASASARSPRSVRLGASLALAVYGAASSSHLYARPLLSFVLLILGATWLDRIFAWTRTMRSSSKAEPHLATHDQLVVWALYSVLSIPFVASSKVGIDVMVVAPAIFLGVRASIAALDDLSARDPDRRASWVVLMVTGWSLAAVVFWIAPRAGLSLLCLGPVLPLLTSAGAPSSGPPRLLDSVVAHPARLLVSTFFGLCVTGGMLLSLDSAHAGMTLSVLDAAFTSVSAVCVTGLVVVDTPTAYTPFGQVLILLLIQIGGLGIMTFSSGALLVLGRRLSLKHEATLASLVGSEDRRRLLQMLGRTFAVTFGFEVLGSALLTRQFMTHGDEASAALWRALFTSVSAFCNAGFALQSDSLIPYQTDPIVLHTVGVLIVAGGLSPLIVWLSFRRIFRRRSPMPIAFPIVWSSTLVLLGVSTVAFIAMEWDASLGQLGLLDRLHNGIFQAVTLRTAGFNSVDLNATRSGTRTFMMLMMFIGAAPGGTAGGIKLTTAFVLLLALLTIMRGQTSTAAFGRRISHRTVYRAAAIATLGFAMNFTIYIALQLTQAMDDGVALFETVSALGTVGLSIGGTAQLDDVGKIIVMLAMFMGRVGPLTAFLFLAERVSEVSWRLPEVDLDVG